MHLLCVLFCFQFKKKSKNEKNDTNFRKKNRGHNLIRMRWSIEFTLNNALYNLVAISKIWSKIIDTMLQVKLLNQFQK